MQIKLVHAHFLISVGNYSNERIGFSVELDDGETPENVVPQLREKARRIVGQPADELYEEKYKLENTIRELEKRLKILREEWDKTAEFLKAQGIKPEASHMPQFSNLLSASKVEEESTVIDGELAEF
ncbi:hypothetical protein [Allocoleopsis sp.]|uniref:hypothetical protein n=1 Tax=Allocoleopsis sp. TaxID=3088169 RepID=UPI002FD11D4F